MWDGYFFIFNLVLLIIFTTTPALAMCPSMEMNPWALMTPCKEDNKGSVNPTVKSTPYCSKEEKKDSGKPGCFSFTEFRNGGYVSANSPRESLLPPWINIPLARKGQIFAQDNLYGLLAAHIFGLFSSAYPDSAGINCFTGASETEDLSGKRYLATMTHFIIWYDDLLSDKMSSDSDVLASIQRIREMHLSVAENAKERLSKKLYLNDPNLYANYTMKTALNGPFHKDLEESNIPAEQREPPNINPAPAQKDAEDIKFPFNQQIQSLMIFAMVGTPVAFPERYGISQDEEELYGYSHLWAVYAYAIGIDDKYNVALQPDLATAKEAYKKIYEDFNIRSMFNIRTDPITLVAGEKALVGLQKILPIMTPNLILYRMLVDLYQVPGKNTYDILTSSEKQANAIYDADRKATLGSGGRAKMAAMNNAARAALMRGGFANFGMNYGTQKDQARRVFSTTR